MSLAHHLANAERQAEPEICPFCRSAKILTAGKQVDASSYWRCQTCGQMWNMGRLRAFTRNGYAIR